MTKNLELKLEGEVKVESGKLLIVDPYNLSNLAHLGFGLIEKQIDTEYDSLFALSEEEVKIMKKEAKAFRYQDKLFKEKVIDKEFIKRLTATLSIFEKTRQKISEIKRRKIDLIKQVKLNPPYLAETDNFLTYFNPIGGWYLSCN